MIRAQKAVSVALILLGAVAVLTTSGRVTSPSTNFAIPSFNAKDLAGSGTLPSFRQAIERHGILSIDMGASLASAKSQLFDLFRECRHRNTDEDLELLNTALSDGTRRTTAGAATAGGDMTLGAFSTLAYV